MRPKALTEAATLEVVVESSEGASLREIAKHHGCGASTIRRLLNQVAGAASWEQMAQLKKDLARQKLAIVSVADALALKALLERGERFSPGELSIVSGIATQRAADLEKGTTMEDVPDWSSIAGWAGSPEDPATAEVMGTVQSDKPASQ